MGHGGKVSQHRHGPPVCEALTRRKPEHAQSAIIHGCALRVPNMRAQPACVCSAPVCGVHPTCHAAMTVPRKDGACADLRLLPPTNSQPPCPLTKSPRQSHAAAVGSHTTTVWRPGPRQASPTDSMPCQHKGATLECPVAGQSQLLAVC